MFAILLSGRAAPTQPGALDSSFAPIFTRPATEPLYSAVLQPDGKWLIGGNFYAVQGTIRPRFARLNPDGSLDPSLNATLPGAPFLNVGVPPAIQADGKIVAVTGTTVVRLHPDGILDESFRAAPVNPSYYSVRGVHVGRDGKILILGQRFLARLNSDGTLDSSFNVALAPEGGVYALAQQPDGKILLGGSFRTINGVSSRGLARLNEDGTVDANFNTGKGPEVYPFNSTTPPGEVWAFQLYPDGRILAGGWFGRFDSLVRPGLARLNPDGSVDRAFNPDLGPGYSTIVGREKWISAIALTPDGNVLVGENLDPANSDPSSRIVRLNPNGSRNSPSEVSFRSSGVECILRSISVLAGQIHVTGSFTTLASGESRLGLAALNLDGSLTQALNPRLELLGPVRALAVQPDDKVLVGGQFSRVNGVDRPNLARLNKDGSLDDQFAIGVGPDADIRAITLHTDGKILIGGSFANVSGRLRNSVARLNPDGSVDSTFDSGDGAKGPFVGCYVGCTVTAIAAQPDGKIIVGGPFTSFDGLQRNGVARLNPQGSVDQDFDVGAVTFDSAEAWSYRVNSLALDNLGRILVAGSFTSFNGFPRYRIASLNPDGTTDQTFDPGIGLNSTAHTLLVQPDGKVLVAGRFSKAAGVDRHGLTRFESDGRLDIGFADPGVQLPIPGTNRVWSIAVQKDGKILIGGNFRDVNGGLRAGIARLQADGVLDTRFDPGAGVQANVLAIALTPQQDRLLIGGDFTSVDNLARSSSARLWTIPRPSLGGGSFAGAGVFQFNLLGEPGLQYQVEWSSDLSSWSSLRTVFLTNSPQHLLDASSPGEGRKFYRARFIP